MEASLRTCAADDTADALTGRGSPGVAQVLHCRPASCPDAAICSLADIQLLLLISPPQNIAINVGRGRLQGLMLGVGATIQEHRSRASGALKLLVEKIPSLWVWRLQRCGQSHASWCVGAAACSIPESAGDGPEKWVVPCCTCIEVC